MIWASERNILRIRSFVRIERRSNLSSGISPISLVCVALSTVLVVLDPVAARADEFFNPRTTFGEVGILEMPSARTAPDGQLLLSYGELKDTQRFNFGFQITPWLEASFRYSHIPRLFGVNNYYDRSFGMKMRLEQESEYIPEISLGMRDILGTGIYSGEYLVASKRVGDVDLTLGMGWGRFAQSGALPNPLAKIFPSFETRSGGAQNGGTVNFGQLFHGPRVGLFGGAIWQTPIENLEFLIEYSSDRYQSEQSFGNFSPRTPINVGLAYRAYDAFTVSAGWFYGTTYGLTLSLTADPTVSNVQQKFGPDIPAPVIRSPEQQVNALSQLLDNRKIVVATASSGPWVDVPPSKSAAINFDLQAAIMSIGTDVHDVAFLGRTVMIDASVKGVTPQQCAHYAKIASTIASPAREIAVSDMTDSSGRVAICAIPSSSEPIADADTPNADLDAGASDADPAAAAARIRAAADVQGIKIDALSIEPEMVWLYFSNGLYQSETEAVGRISRILMANAPASVEVFHIVSTPRGLPQRDFRVIRSALERATEAYGTVGELSGALASSPPPLSNPVLDRATADDYPQFHWSIGPGLRTGFFDPTVPLQVQVLAAANASLDITPNFSLDALLEGNIYNNFDTKRLSDSLLPHVRSDLNSYVRDGANGIAVLDAVYRTRLTPEIYFEGRAGILEDMFAGAGAQVLWRPEASRFTFGADVYQVWQRDFNRLFGVRGYHVLTGHVSAYYQSPWYGLNFAVHAGRYLAADYGATFEITRRFSTGVEIGAFATFTNVPFSKFGEGSFDKGLIIRIPLEWALPFYTQTSYDIRLRSLVRDGGQRLDNDDSLFEETRAASYGEVTGHGDEIIAP